MAQNDDLFDLIRSLTPSEKRYFKVHADKYSNGGYKKQYEKLYDAINNWSAGEYDEKEFRRKYKGKAFLKNLPSDKNYLRELVLKVIRNYGSENDPETELPELLLSIRLLINKGLKNQVNKLIEKAMRIGEEREQYNEMLVIHDFLLRFYRMSPGEAPYTAKEIEQMDKDILDRITLTRQALYLRTHMVEIQSGGQWQAREPEAREIMLRATELATRQNLPKRAELSLLNVRQFYLIHYHRYQECLDITAEWLHKIEQSTRPFDFSPDQYKVTLSNYLHCALLGEKLDLMPPVIGKLKSLKANTEKEAAEYFRISTQYELTYLINKEQLAHADEMLNDIEDGLKRYKRFFPEAQIVNFRFNIALLFFLRKQYAEALKNINELYFLSGRNESYAYTTTMARTMEWMCLYSLGEYAVLDSYLRNLKRYFSDRKMKNELFDTMFELFGKKLKDAGLQPTSMEKLRSRMKASQHPQEWEQVKGMVLTWA